MLNKKLSPLVLPLVLIFSLQANELFFKDPFGDDIFKDMMKMQKEMDKVFDQMHQRTQQGKIKSIRSLTSQKIANKPRFVDKGNHYEYMTNIPENKENQIDISVKDSVLNMRAKIIEKQENKTKNSLSSSSSIRMYQHSIPLPKDVDEGSLNAKYINGKLLISIQKKKQERKKEKIQELQKEENNTSRENNNSKENNTSKNITINSDLLSLG